MTTTTTDALTPLQQTLLDLLTQTAEDGAPCPSLTGMIDALGCNCSPDTANRAFRHLIGVGLITSETTGAKRRVTITATGKTTGWTGYVCNVHDHWGATDDATLLSMARDGLSHTLIAARIGRSASAVRHRLRRLRAQGVDVAPTTGAASAPPNPSAPRPLPPVQAHIITNDRNRPAQETAQIAAFLAAGKATKLPPAYVGAVLGGQDLTGTTPIGYLARRALRRLPDQGYLSPYSLARKMFLHPAVAEDLVQELARAGLADRRKDGAARRAGGAA